MRLSDLHPCDGCGGPLFTPPGRWFQVVRATGALITPSGLEIVKTAARHGIPLERVAADISGSGVVELGDQNTAFADELLLCVGCYHDRPIAEIARRRRERMELEVAQGRAS